MGRVLRGAVVRALYSLCILLMTVLVVVIYEGGMKASGSWVFVMGILALIIEGIVTKKMTQGFDWKWFNPATIVFCANGLAVVWFLQLRVLSYSSQGLDVCTNYTAEYELAHKVDLTVPADWLDFCSCGHCNGAAEQFFVTVLLIGRYFLPKGVSFYHPDDDKINLFLKSIARTHFYLVLACNGADALDLISYSRYSTVQGNGYIISMLLILFSASLSQFCIDTLATTEHKDSDLHIIVETDLWSSLLILIVNDLPFLAMRLFLMTNYQVFSAMGVYFFFKNFVCICVTLHKGVMIWLGKDMEEIEEYVASEPYSPEPPERLSRMGTPDSLNDLSDSDSMYSNEVNVKSRNEKHRRKDSDWGNSPTDINKKVEAPGSQFIGRSSEWDIEAGEEDTKALEGLANEKLDIWNPKADPAYFTENYADECDAMIDMSQIGNRKFIEVPLGIVSMRGPINFDLAAPKPELRDIDSAKAEKKRKSQKHDNTDDTEKWSDEQEDKPRKNSKDLDEDIDDILNTVDDEDRKEKKKKKKKDKDRDQEEEEIMSDKEEEKKHKKKKSKSDNSEPADDEDSSRKEKRKKKKSKGDDLEPIEEEEEDRKEKHKKKKKSKDKDRDADD